MSLSTILCCLFRAALGLPGDGGEGGRLSLAGGLRALWRVWGAAPSSQSLFPKCSAHPGAAGERLGEGGCRVVSELMRQASFIVVNMLIEYIHCKKNK